MIEIGQQVTWTSQAGGNSKTKTGKVLAIIKANAFGLRANAFYVLCQALREKFVLTKHLTSNQIKFQHISQVDRAIVEVPRKSGVMDYYCPRLSVVEKLNH